MYAVYAVKTNGPILHLIFSWKAKVQTTAIRPEC